MVDSKRYGVTENIVPSARLPKVEVCIDGKKKKTSKIEYHPRSVDNVQTKLHNTAGLLELIRLVWNALINRMTHMRFQV